MSENEIFVCDKCDKKFTTKFSLNRHQFIHSQVKKYGCRFCPKRFALKQYLKEHECIHTNSRPYVCGVNGCQMRFRQRGKLSLHRRKHKGYKMKEYTLIKEQADLSENMSETETLANKSHQNINNSINEVSDINEDTHKSGRSSKQTKQKKKLKAKNESGDTDSDFEIPTYSNKDKVGNKKRSLRKRKASNIYVADVDNSHSEDIPLDFSEDISENKVEHEEPTQYRGSNFLSVPDQKRKFRKYSNDSTLDGSQSGKKNQANTKKGISGFSKSKQHKAKESSNFGALLKAFKVYQNLTPITPSTQYAEKEKCEERKFTNVPDEASHSSTAAPTLGLNNLAGLLASNTLYNLQNGSDVNAYFSHLRNCLSHQ